MSLNRYLRATCALVVTAVFLAGCGGGGSSAASPSSASSSSPSSSPSSSGTTTSSQGSSSTGSGSGSGSSGSGSSGSGSSGSGGGSTPAATGSATVSWSAPTTNTNGSALTDLAGYHIYYGTSASSLTQVVDVSSASATSYAVPNLASGTWYFEVTSITSAGVESAPSSVVSKTIT